MLCLFELDLHICQRVGAGEVLRDLISLIHGAVVNALKKKDELKDFFCRRLRRRARRGEN